MFDAFDVYECLLPRFRAEANIVFVWVKDIAGDRTFFDIQISDADVEISVLLLSIHIGNIEPPIFDDGLIYD